jgi:hypothetical protein
MTAEAPTGRWNLDERHFKWRNAHVKPSIGYKLWFYNLRLSRDYYLAHKEALGRLNYNEELSLPVDFDSVRRTYALVGSVWDGLFEGWWLNRGRELFAIAGPEICADVIHRVPPSRAIDTVKLSSDIERYELNVIHRLQNPETLIVGIPLTGHKTELLEALGRMLDGFQDVPRPAPTLRLNNKIIQPNALKNYLDLIWVRMNEPWLDLWEICMRIGLSGKARVLRAEGKIPDTSLKDEMASTTSTMYSKARLISESAARGSFPTPLNLERPAETDEDVLERRDSILNCYEIETAQLTDSEFRATVQEFY